MVLNPANSFFIETDDAQLQNGNLTLSEENAAKLADDKNYEIVAMYYIPSGGKAIDSAPADWYTVHHMDAAKVADYMNEWLGNENLAAILEKHSNVRAYSMTAMNFIRIFIIQREWKRWRRMQKTTDLVMISANTFPRFTGSTAQRRFIWDLEPQTRI